MVLVFYYIQEAGIKLVAGVREGLKQRMVDDKWLDDVTRQRSIEKVKINILVSI